MNANELLNRMIASGIENEIIRDRFSDNADQYEKCFLAVMEAQSFVVLRDAIHTRSYSQAVEAVETLAGIYENLGITEFHDPIHILDDSLKNAQYDDIVEAFVTLDRQRERRKPIPAEEPKRDIIPEDPPDASQKHTRFFDLRSLFNDKSSKPFKLFLYATAIAILVICLMFFVVNIVHSRKVTQESGQHLMEISNQIKLDIEDSIATDWRIAQSVGDSILSSAFKDDDAAIFAMLQNKQTIWGVSDLMLYTENGACIYTDGSTESTDVASKIIFQARKHGKWLSIIDSRLIYTVPVDTDLTFRGAKIVAISTVRDMSSLLRNMNFSSFGGTAHIYLSNQDGIIISSLDNTSTAQAFNIQAIVKGMTIKPLDETNSPTDFLSNQDTTVFLLSDGVNNVYGVSTPIETGNIPMHLFYSVPENVVNNVMSGFALQLSVFSISMVILFAVFASIASLIVYQSRKKLFDRAILTRERMFDLLVKNTKIAVGLLTVNHAQPEYLSVNVSEVMGDSGWSLCKTNAGYSVHNEQRIETENIAIVNKALQSWDGKQPFRSDYLCNARRATPAYFVFALFPIDDGAINFVGIAQDVTQVYDREKAVKNAMESAKQANEAKTRFLSRMSHDIRTPMNAIMNMSNFALESIGQPKELSDYLRVINESAEHLLHLINDVLDMSRIESGQMTMSSTPFEIKKELQRQAEMIRPMCNAKKQTLITNFNGLEETVVSGDALKFSQIVINLLSNAMKYTQETGIVRFVVKEIPSLRDDMLTIHLRVEDNGIGIPAEDIDRIFEPFNRASDKAVSRIEGTGLGLAIVRNYIDAMGGSIRCESEIGKGTTFTVELFFQRTNVPIEQDNLNTDLTNDAFLGMQALVAEDHYINQMIAKLMLERMGFVLDFVDDGSEAVQKFCGSKPNTYDVIYMDIQMPVMDGLTAAMQIRASDHPQAKTIPIIALTADAFAEDIEKARAAGFDGYVDKPIEFFKLAEQTKRVILDKREETK